MEKTFYLRNQLHEHVLLALETGSGIMKTLWIRIGKKGADDEAFLATVGERGFINTNKWWLLITKNKKKLKCGS